MPSNPELDLTSVLQPIRIRGGSDTPMSVDGVLTDWVSTLTIYESTGNGMTPTGDAIVTLTEGDGIETNDDQDSMVITFPSSLEDYAGDTLFYRLVRVIDDDSLEVMHGPLAVV